MLSVSILKNGKALLAAPKVASALVDEVTLHVAPQEERALWFEAVSTDSSSYLQLWLNRADCTCTGTGATAATVSLKKMVFAMREMTTQADVVVVQADPSTRAVTVIAKTKKSETVLPVNSSAASGVRLAEELLEVPADSEMDWKPFDVKALEDAMKAARQEKVALPQRPGAMFNRTALTAVLKSGVSKTGVMFVPKQCDGADGLSRPIVVSYPLLKNDSLSRLRVHVCPTAA